jgi:hypothetical protein
MDEKVFCIKTVFPVGLTKEEANVLKEKIDAVRDNYIKDIDRKRRLDQLANLIQKIKESDGHYNVVTSAYGEQKRVSLIYNEDDLE